MGKNLPMIFVWKILPNIIKISSEITQSKDDQLKPLFLPYQNKKIHLPEKYKYLPGKEFLEYHNDVRFRK